MIQRRNQNNDNDNDDDDELLQYIPLTSPRLMRSNAQSHHCLHVDEAPNNLILPPSSNQHRNNRSHSQANLFYSHRQRQHHPHRHRRSQSAFKYLYCDKCRLRFHSLTELERHKSVHHSPAAAAISSARYLLYSLRKLCDFLLFL